MTDTIKSIQRRRLLGATLCLLPLSLGVSSRVSAAATASLPALSEDDPVATTLGYREDAGQVDAARFTKFARGRTCGNCQFLSSESGDWGQCTIFQGKKVKLAGWCSAWAPNMG